MPAWRAGKGRNKNLNEHRTITPAAQFQARRDRSDAPLREALLHASQTKLVLRRARSEETGFQRGECLARLLEGIEHICTSLDWLTGAGFRAVTPGNLRRNRPS